MHDGDPSTYCPSHDLPGTPAALFRMSVPQREQHVAHRDQRVAQGFVRLGPLAYRVYGREDA